MNSSDFVAPEYKPTDEVVAVHNIFHLNPMSSSPLEPVDNTFDPFNTAYLYSVAAVPCIILIVGIVAIILLFIISNCCAPGTCFWKYCWYYICCCFCCPPKEKSITDDRLEVKKEEWFNRASRATKACYVVIFAIVVGSCLLWWGNADLTSGMQDAIDAVKYLMGTLTSLFSDINGPDSVISRTTDFNTILNGNSCGGNQMYANGGMQTVIASMASTTDAIAQAGDKIEALAEPIDTGLGALKVQIEAQIPVKDMYVRYVFIGLIVLSFFNFLTSWRKNAYISFFVSIFNYVLMIILLVICSVTMIVVMLLADFCFDPSFALTTLAGGAADTVRFFTTCTGTNRFQSQIQSLNTQLGELDNYVSASCLQSGGQSLRCVEETIDAQHLYCGDCIASYSSCNRSIDCYMCTNALSPQIGEISDKISDVTDTLGCETIYHLYDKLINQAFCTSSFSGIYKVWGDLYFIALFLFVLICCMSKLYQYMVSDVQTTQPWKKEHYKVVATTNSSDAAPQLTDAEIELGNMNLVGGVGVNVL